MFEDFRRNPRKLVGLDILVGDNVHESLIGAVVFPIRTDRIQFLVKIREPQRVTTVLKASEPHLIHNTRIYSRVLNINPREICRYGFVYPEATLYSKEEVRADLAYS